MSDEFYCGCCGKWKKIETKQKSPAGKRPVCAACNARKERIIKGRSEVNRDKARTRSVTRKTIDHLMPNI